MNTTTPATIELIGSFTARHVESGTTVDLHNRRNRGTTKSPIPVLCRELIHQGYNPQDRVHVIRKALDREGCIPIFKRDRSLEAWARVDMVESETRSLHIVTHRPFPDSVSAKDAHGRIEVGKGSPKRQRHSTASTATLGVAA